MLDFNFAYNPSCAYNVAGSARSRPPPTDCRSRSRRAAAAPRPLGDLEGELHRGGRLGEECGLPEDGPIAQEARELRLRLGCLAGDQGRNQSVSGEVVGDEALRRGISARDDSVVAFPDIAEKAELDAEGPR